MIVEFATRTLKPYPNGNGSPAQFGAEDAKAFIEADGDEQIEGLMTRYANPCEPLFGWHMTEEEAECLSEMPEASNSPASFENLAELARTLSKLVNLQERLYVERGSQNEYANLELIEDLGIAVDGLEDMSSSGYDLTLNLPLTPDPDTKAFLEEGIRHARYSDLGCKADDVRCPNGEPMFLMLTVKSRTFLYPEHHLYEPVEDLLNRFLQILLHDASLRVCGDEVFLQAESTASSICFSVLDTAREGHVKQCAYCGKTFTALDEHRPRKFCSDKCNKSHQRVTKFKKLVDDGKPAEEAAKAVGMSLKKCTAYWSMPMQVRHRSNTTGKYLN